MAGYSFSTVKFCGSATRELVMYIPYHKLMCTCMFSKSVGKLASLCKGALQELLLELVLVTLRVRITWSDPPGT
jgi:hypothetical protein